MPLPKDSGISALKTIMRSTPPSGSSTKPCTPIAKRWSAATSRTARSSEPAVAKRRCRSAPVALSRPFLNVEGYLQPRCHVGRLALAPEVREVDHRLLADHVIVRCPP